MFFVCADGSFQNWEGLFTLSRGDGDLERPSKEAHLESSHVPGVTPWECIYISNRATQSQEICPWIAVSKWQTHFILTQNIYSTLLINHIGTSSCTTQNRSVNTFSKTQIYKRIKWTKVIIFSLWNLTKYRWGNFSLENCWIFFFYAETLPNLTYLMTFLKPYLNLFIKIYTTQS